ncbi:MAG: hypothetical protein R3C05_28775 [Pirellulaceae bacterium]
MEPSNTGSMHKYLDKRLQVLDKFGLSKREDTPQEMIHLLESVKALMRHVSWRLPK